MEKPRPKAQIHTYIHATNAPFARDLFVLTHSFLSFEYRRLYQRGEQGPNMPILCTYLDRVYEVAARHHGNARPGK